MKMKWMAVLSCALAVSLMSGTAALAKSDHQNGNNSNSGNAAAASAHVDAKKEDKNEGKKDTVGSDDKKESVTSAVYDDNKGGKESVTSATYGQSHGYKGLLNAIENVKDKPAGAVLANLLLTKYELQLTAEKKAELEKIVEQDKALSAVADLLNEKGSVVDAVYVQKEAIKANFKNLDSYVKLGKLNKKAGKAGIVLFVNGNETTPAVAPILRNGSTLVPFRAISEALNAEVTYNAKEGSVTVTRDGQTVKLLLNSKKAYVNGKPVQLAVPATVVKGSTVVPVRFVSEALNTTVKWEPVSQSVIVYEE